MNPIIAFYIENMSNKEHIYELFNNFRIKYRNSDTYKKLAERYCKSSIDIPIDEFTIFYRSKWSSSPINLHIANLKSGLLIGHSWHKASPSILHLSMQDRVRECIDGQFDLIELIEIGSDIMKHEYFMVATHDICESSIIENFAASIPPTREKSVSDFVFNGIPYDLKVSTYPEGWNKSAYTDRSEYIKALSYSLYVGADSDRMRKQAEKSGSSLAFNRFYVMVNDQDKWLSSPDDMVNEIVAKSNALGNPEKIVVHGIDILVQLIEI